ncbi:MAG: cyclase family protein [Chlorobium sp.]|jgi:kynurenine formamidase|nr:cyclase family protein [Chlorobium sp.]
MNIIDLTHSLEPGMPVYPGTPPPLFQELFSFADQGFRERQITLTTHTGTHLDVPSHILERGDDLDSFSVQHFAGPAAVISLNCSPTTRLAIGDIEAHLPSLRECDFLLLSSGWSRYWGSEKYFTGYPVLSMEAASALAGLGLKGIGVDMISVDDPDAHDLPVHRIFLEKRIILVENLANLEKLPPVGFDFFCMPLKLSRSEASPVRAIAII